MRLFSLLNGSLVLKKRLVVGRFNKIIVLMCALLFSFVLSSILFMISGANPFAVLVTMFTAVFGSIYGFSETFLISIPIATCAMAVGVAAIIKIWNIGAEGQFVFGALGAGVTGIYFSYLPPFLLLPLSFLMGMLFSSILAVIPGVLKAWMNVNEILVTLMLNYIATLFVMFLLYGPLKGSDNFPYSKSIPTDCFLPVLAGTRLHIGIFVVILLGVVLYFITKKSVWGYELRVLGESYSAARYAGIGVRRNIVIVMVISGAIAGLGGVLEVTGLQHRLQPSLSQGYGFTGIIVSWLSKNNMITILFVSFFIAGLFVSGNEMQISNNLPSSIIKVFQGIVFVSILGSDIFTEYKLCWEKK